MANLNMRRPWHKFVKRRQPDQILMFAKQNYKIYVDIGLALFNHTVSLLD